MLPCTFAFLTTFRPNNEVVKPSKQEVRRAEAAAKRQKMLAEQQREKDKVKDRLDLIRQMKGKDVPRAHCSSCTTAGVSITT